MRLVLAAAAALATAQAFAQGYPAKPIRGVMSLGGGGSAETALRSISLKFSESTGQPHHRDVSPLDSHPRYACCGRVGADGTEAEADRRPRHQPAERNHH